jgi:glycosyltransferase involved in cell wall biosynthesis
MQVTHVITGLTMGGAESALYKFVEVTRELGVRHTVVSLTSEYAEGKSDYFGARLQEDGIPVHTLGMRQGAPDPRALARLVRLLVRDRPQVVHSWMWHANLIAGLAAAPLRIPVVWDIHHVDVDPANLKRMSHLTNVACARLSGLLADRVVCRADAAAATHIGLGYRADRMQVIPNGTDVASLVADPAAGAVVRKELDIPDGAPVVGIVGRLHPDKDHDNFLRAARIVADERPDTVFVMSGAQVDRSSPELASRVDELGLRDSVRMTGIYPDLRALMSSFDLLVSSSRTEAFPLVLGEAMACLVPCVATDCGDTSALLGSTGWIVPTRDPSALGAAVLEALALTPAERADHGRRGREHIRQNYDIGGIARRYVDLYAEVAAR